MNMLLKMNKNKKILLSLSVLFVLPLSIALDSQSINYLVPFVSQAPLAQWDDPRQQDACEEAVVLMSMAWVRAEPSLSKEEWRDRILELADFQAEKYGEHRDTSLEDIIQRLFLDYFSYEKVRLEPVIKAEDIILELEKGNIVLIPANGQLLKNPNFTSPGPERHMVLIKGYDYSTKEFITNDPGTRNGANYRYDRDLLFEAIKPYKTGYHEDF